MPFLQSDAAVQAFVRVFRQELLRLGWSEGGNVQFDERWSTDNMDVVRADAASLVELKPDVILILGDRVIPVFMKLTSSIPIVVGAVSDPIASGAAESLAWPGHNVTGFFAHRVLDVRKGAGAFETDRCGHFPCRHDV
jgi:ABC-type uncharacterized transport system substrate-binding protein